MVSRKNFSSLYPTLGIIFTLMLVLMFVFELVKQYANPSLTIWESHSITIIFTSILAVIILYYPLRTAYREQQNVKDALLHLQEAEEKLRQSEMQYHSFVESVEDSLYTVDLDLHYLLINTRHLVRRGLSPDMYSGKKYGDFHSEKETRVFATYVDQVVRTKSYIQDEYEQNGRHFLRKLNPVIDTTNNEVTAVTVISSDITDRKRIEKSLEDTNRKLSLMNDITRHDILNQLLVLNSYLSLAGERSQDPEVKKYIIRTEQVADLIHAQILFARDYQTIGVESPRWQNVLTNLVHARQSLKIPTLDIHPSCSRFEIFADPLLEKVFYNLMENCLKYGGANASIRFFCHETDGALTITYQDTGPGISPDEKEKIFLRGYGKNTGLGLFLIREILAMTGISIHETGEPGNGARFEIIVPKGGFRSDALPGLKSDTDQGD
ncbi:ATP-binding protein [uncultured Methanoregula sp.]|uniref:sensor histidine kinase n=1 Tax=uncultured Methanoregula sp. TaxID=1005933 RepID=UPI002AABD85A|nr:ATP-binding protein [uncultured Methanoregula sp.]